MGSTRALTAVVVSMIAFAASSCSAGEEEMTPAMRCEQVGPAALMMEAASDERGTGVRWTEIYRLDGLPEKAYALYRRAAVDGQALDISWEKVEDVVLKRGAPREIVPVELPPGRWEFGVTYQDPDCERSPLCTGASCPSVVLDAVQPQSARTP